jgi:hypothetical protein
VSSLCLSLIANGQKDNRARTTQKTEEGALRRSLFRFAFCPLRYFFLVVFFTAFFVAFFAAFLVAISTILPFDVYIEYCSVAPQLHEGIVLRKIIVKKKILFLCEFF